MCLPKIVKDISEIAIGATQINWDTLDPNGWEDLHEICFPSDVKCVKLSSNMGVYYSEMSDQMHPFKLR